MFQDNFTSVKDEGNGVKVKDEQNRGLIFISHLPLGFYEDEVKRYFLQFGKVTNVKVCRSQRTGRSRGCGYVEFLQPDIAKMAAETVNNFSLIQEKLKGDFLNFCSPVRCKKILLHIPKF